MDDFSNINSLINRLDKKYKISVEPRSRGNGCYVIREKNTNRCKCGCWSLSSLKGIIEMILNKEGL